MIFQLSINPGRVQVRIFVLRLEYIGWKIELSGNFSVVKELGANCDSREGKLWIILPGH